MKKNFKKIINFIKKNFKIVLYLFANIVLVYLLVLLLTKKPQMPAEYKAKIDSLNIVDNYIIEKQKALDASILENKAKSIELDFKIDNIKEKTTIVREYYRETQSKVDKYNPTQIDSFLKNRYQY